MVEQLQMVQQVDTCMAPQWSTLYKWFNRSMHAWRRCWTHSADTFPVCVLEQVLNPNFHLLVCNCGTTALHIAAANGDVHIAMLILKHYVSVGPCGRVHERHQRRWQCMFTSCFPSTHRES